MNTIDIREALNRSLAPVGIYSKLSLSSISQFFTGRNPSPWLRYDWSKVNQWFEGYEDPFTLFSVIIDGVEYQYSVAELCFFSRSEAYRAESTINSILTRLLNSGVLSTRFVQPPSHVLNAPTERLRGYDSRWQHPSQFSRYPSNTELYFPHSELVRDSMPIPKIERCELFLGENFFDTTAYPSSRLIDDIMSLCVEIRRKHDASNCNDLYSPLVSLGFSLHDNSGLFELFDMYADGQTWLQNLVSRQLATGDTFITQGHLDRIPNLTTERSRKRYMYHGFYGLFNSTELERLARLNLTLPSDLVVARCVEPPGISRINFYDRRFNEDYVVDQTIPSVIESLRTRNRAYARSGYKGFLSDVGTEFLQVVIAANACAMIPPHVLLHGTMQFYHNCLMMAYGTTGFQSTTAMYQYAANVERENQVRRSMRDQAGPDAIGYTALAGLDLFAARTMGTAQLAAINGQQNNTRPFASVGRAIQSIEVLLNQPQDQERRDLYVLQDGVPPMWYENNWIPTLNPMTVVNTRPFKRNS